MKNIQLKLALKRQIKVALVAVCIFYGMSGLLRANVWNQSAGGTYSWNNNANWEDGSAAFPNGQGVSATISTAITGDQIINFGQSITLGSLTIGAASGNDTGKKYTVSAAAGQTLTMDNGESVATITHSVASSSVTDSINAAIVITNGLNVVNVTSNNFTVGGGTGGGVTGTGNITLDGGGINLNGTINNVGTITCVTNGTNNAGTGTIGGNLGANVMGLIINRAAKTQTIALGGTNTAFAGNVTVTKGTLRITGANSLNASNVVSMANSTDAAINVNVNVTIAGLSGAGAVSSSGTGTYILTLGGSGNYSFNPNGSTDSATSKVGLNVALTGSGSQTLTTGTWGMRGGITVSSGQLIMAYSDVFKGYNYSMGVFTLSGGTFASSVANVNLATATNGGANMDFLLSGGALDLNGTSGGALTLGNTATGSAASNFTMSAGTIKLTLNSAVDYDKIIGVTAVGAPSTFTISGGTIDFGNTVTDYVSTYQIFSGFGSGNVSGLNFINYDTTNYLANISSSGLLSFTAIPEPGTYVLLAMGMMVVVGVTFRKGMRLAV